MRVLILGGDGYLGWPTAMRFSGKGHEVAVADNFARRRWVDGGRRRLADADRLAGRADRRVARAPASGSSRYVGDLAEGTFAADLVRDFQPDTIIHYGEQPSAPWSMRASTTPSRPSTTTSSARSSCCGAMRDHAPDAHLIKLGTMGEYGTPNIDIEEGFIEITHNGRTRRAAVPEDARLAVPPLEGARQPQHPLRLPRLGPALRPT